MQIYGCFCNFAKKTLLMTKIEQYIIDKVRSERIKQNISQMELANFLDVSPGFISSIESLKGKAKYNLNHINKLSLLFKCSPKDFLPIKHFEDVK